MAVTRIKNSGIKTGVLKYDSMLAGNAAYDPAATWLIQRTTLSSSTSSVTFSSIPTGYTSLQIRYTARSTNASTGDSPLMLINGDTGNNYAYHLLSANGTAVSASGGSSYNAIFCPNISAANATASIFGAGIIDIHDYNSTSNNKTVRSFGGWDGNGSGFTQLRSGFRVNTAAITSITLNLQNTGGSFASGSTFALYGFKGA